MIVKFHARGAGRGSGPVDYLLGKERNRDGATLDRGDPDEIQSLIDSSPYAKNTRRVCCLFMNRISIDRQKTTSCHVLRMRCCQVLKRINIRSFGWSIEIREDWSLILLSRMWNYCQESGYSLTSTRRTSPELTHGK